MKFIVVVILLCFLSTTKADEDLQLTTDDLKEIVDAIAQTAKITIATIGDVTSKALAHVRVNNVTFRMYSKETINDVDGIPLKLPDARLIDEKAPDFNKDFDTVFVVHGWKNNCSVSTMVQTIKAALLENIVDVNVIAVCWEDFSLKFYHNAVAAVPQVGAYLGQFIKNLSESQDYPMSKIKIVGHSLGAQIAGFAGKSLNGELHHIIGLDPAGPLFPILFPGYRLASTDAKYVEVIHTDILLLGIPYSAGSVDFYPNGGFAHPGCTNDLTRTCAHSRAIRFFAEALRNSYKFMARSCPLYTTFLMRLCSFNRVTSMGKLYDYSEWRRGNFYLTTNSEPPYGKEEEGLKPSVSILGHETPIIG